MKKDKLYIVIPAYNEEKNIKEVINYYAKIVNKIKNDSKLIIVDDGSKDNTYNIALKEAKKYKNVEILKKENGGHGSALIYGYNYALKNGADYIFQIDSDNQTNPEEFWNFWNQRSKKDIIIGSRRHRKDGFSRIIVTKVLKYLLLLIFGVKVEDANTPFRLMKANILQKYIDRFKPNYNLPNVMLSVYFVFYKEKIKFIPITFEDRKAGVNSINIKKICKIGLNSIKDFYTFRDNMINKTNNKKYDKMFVIIFCFILSVLGITFVSTCSPIYFTNMYPDTNAYFTVGKSILNGFVPYRDLFDQKGPILYFIYALAALISYKSFIGVYIIEILLFTIFLYYNHKIINLFINNKFTYIILPIFSALILTSQAFAGGGIPEEIFLSFFSYSIYKLLKNTLNNKFLSNKELFIHGLLAGTIFMTKFTLVGLYFGFMLFIIIKNIVNKRYKKIFTNSFIFLFGMSIPFILCSIYFIINGAFKDFIDTYFIFNLTAYPNSGENNKLKVLAEQLKYLIYFAPILEQLIFIGITYFILHKKIFIKENKLATIFLFLFMFIFIFINGKVFFYYYLPVYVFSIFGFIALFHFFENYYHKISNKVIVLLILSCMIVYIPLLLTSKNLNHLFLNEKSHPIAVFADIIKKDDKNASVINYGFLDSGIHNLLGTVPNTKYYMNLNVDRNKYPKMMNTQDRLIKNKKVDYVLLNISFNDINNKHNKTLRKNLKENYKLVKEIDQIVENGFRKYYLYKKKD